MMTGTYVAPNLILVVDDVALNRQLLGGLLQARGYRVTEACNGVEALAEVARERPDLVLLDLMMPELDGFGVLERLQADQGPFMPVIVVSSAIDLEDRCRALRAGAHDFLSKPIVREELELRVRNVLALKDSQAETSRNLLALQTSHTLLAQQAEQLKRREASLEVVNAALAEHNARVEELVARRTAELSQANERLVAADRHKDEFLAVLGHELRTPLTSVVGFTYLLERTLAPAGGDPMAYVKGIQTGSSRLARLVEMLMDFAIAKAGRLALNCTRVALEEAANAALEPLRSRAAAKSIEVELALAPDAAVQADRVRLDQILQALLDNAVKFTPPGGRIRVEARRDQDMVLTAVVDSGIGFSEEDRPGLFRAFHQADMSNTRPAEGAGLGLAFAQALVEAHGGSIVAESPGKGLGATLRFSLPVAN
ncbi:MAG: multi-sensor hybrid histidine kinase [Cyanobacteria bacterium RYN_339]|nr:multi-sensor hybrid histidine kinase [Cyanobacteria bacterium RYN_339]